ncbi:hypothetical protein [Spirosoma fluviale]|uniref:Uncharacterized protein n=1 Tax=Spirosoma fluviale TaxID=1597977 RepID=A0A286FIP7_9BACT|nr:hypothetical protein [Spirosoma fluviale]SOD83121.1 hypothetical protein SAMN06269250_2370 [Spirosoma fluviale]
MTTEQPITDNPRQPEQPRPIQQWLPGISWVVLGVPIVFFAVAWLYYAVNIPKWDDHALRAFLFYSDQEPSLTGKIYQLFRQHNEHRIVYDRLITRLDYTLFGKLNFVHLMLIGNLSLVGLLLVFTAALRRSMPSQQTVLYALPVALLLFNLSQWENMFWGMASLQNFSVVLWVLAAFYFLSYTRLWGLAVVSATLATLTSGNGLMVWPIGFVILTLRIPAYAPVSGRQLYRPLLGWLAGSALVIGLYFTGFEKPEGIDYVKPSVADLLKGWFAVLGAAAEALPVRAPLRSCILLGGVLFVTILCIVLWTLWNNRLHIVNVFRRVVMQNSDALKTGKVVASMTLFFWSCAAFILGTTLIVAWARTGFGADLLITSRYKMYSLTGLSLLYLYTVVNLPRRLASLWMMGSVISSFVFATLTYYAFLDEAIWWRHWLTTNQFNWTYTTNRPVFSSDSTSQKYTPATPAFYDAALPVLFGSARQPAMELQLTKIKGGYSIENKTFPFQGLRDEGAYVVARSAKRTYLFPVWQNQQSVLAARFRPASVFTDGFKATLLDLELEAGNYQLFVLNVSTKNTFSLYPTNQQLVSKGPPATVSTKNW